MARFVFRLCVILLCLAILAVAIQTIWQRGLAYYGGHWRYAPEDAAWVLDDPTRQLIRKTFSGANGRAVVDHAGQVLTSGRLSGENFSNRSQSAGVTNLDPMAWLSQKLRAQAAGIADSPQPDALYISRLLRQINAMPGNYRLWLQAEDTDDAGSSKAQGAPPSRQPIVTNGYVHWLAGRAPKTLLPVLSIAPGQPDRLARWAKAGVKHMRWNPALTKDTSQQPDKASQALFKALAAHDISLQIAVGEQQTADGHGVWIAPSIAQPALAAGVSVELVLGGSAGARGEQLMPAVFALLDRNHNADLLTVSLAGVLAADRIDSELRPLLQHPQFYSQLVYASGYPDSAAPAAVDLDSLIDQGFIDADREAPLRSIYRVNPLLFVLATMRLVHLPHTALVLPASVFFDS